MYFFQDDALVFKLLNFLLFIFFRAYSANIYFNHHPVLREAKLALDGVWLRCQAFGLEECHCEKMRLSDFEKNKKVHAFLNAIQYATK